jgi:hypothetical protein
MQDDPRLSDYNVPELVDLFVEYVQNQVHKHQIQVCVNATLHLACPSGFRV